MLAPFFGWRHLNVTFEPISLYALHTLQLVEEEVVLGISNLIFFSNGSSPVVPSDAVSVLAILYGSITFKMESGKGAYLLP